MSRDRSQSVRPMLGLMATLLTLVGVGCGNLTPGGIGNATVVVSGDSPESATIALEAGIAPPQRSSHDDDEPEGEVQVEFELFIVDQAGASTQIGEEIEVQVDVGGETEADAVREPLPANRYVTLRIVFIKIEAEIDAGLVIDGTPVTGPIEVDIEDPLPVSRDIDLLVTDGSEVELVIDLNAPAWLQAVDPSTGTVDAMVFASLLAVATR